MFLQRMKEITKPKVHRVEIDLGFGDGIEPLYFRELTFEERQRIFGARAKDDGNLDLRDKGLYLGAELVSASMCKVDGSTIATVDAVKKWDSKFLDMIAGEAMKIVGAQPEGAKDPSTGQS